MLHRLSLKHFTRHIPKPIKKKPIHLGNLALQQTYNYISNFIQTIPTSITGSTYVPQNSFILTVTQHHRDTQNHSIPNIPQQRYIHNPTQSTLSQLRKHTITQSHKEHHKQHSKNSIRKQFPKNSSQIPNFHVTDE